MTNPITPKTAAAAAGAPNLLAASALVNKLMEKPEEKTEAKPAEAKLEHFKVYACSRSSTRLITPKGFRITFTDGKYITQNEEAIAYLDQCIKDHVPGITFSCDATSDDLNPEAALRKKHIAEYLAEQALLTRSDRDMGYTSARPAIEPASSETLPQA